MSSINRVLAVTAFLLPGMLAFGLGTGESGDFEYDGIREIHISGETFDVEAQGTRGRLTSLQVRDQPDNYRVLHSRTDGQLSVWVERSFSLVGTPHDGALILLVPGDAVLRVDTSTGDVRIRNITADRLDVNTSTGDVRLQAVSAAIRVGTSTGSVEIQDSSGRFDISSTTGRIRLDGTTGDINAESSTGHHVYDDVIGNLRARSTTGRIDIDGIQGTLELRTSTGDQTGRRIVLTGNSSFESSTGDIEMDLADDLESLEFDLRSSTGSLTVGRERSQRELYLGGTGFTVRGKSTTGSQEYY